MAIRGDVEGLRALREDPRWAEHLDALARPEPVPGWAADLQRPRGSWWPLGVAAAVALALVLWLRPAPDPYVGVKGTEFEVVVYLEDGAWDGSPLMEGDALRFRLVGDPAPWFAVLLDEGDVLQPVTWGPWPEDGVIPGAWAIEGPVGGTLVVLALDVDPSALAPEEWSARALDEVLRPLE